MPILYLVKGGQDAIAERLSYLLARLLDLPHQQVAWGVRRGFGPAAAIRYEADAFRPERIDPEQGTATRGEEVLHLRNPSDYFRHVALAAFLQEADGEEFMIRNGVLFRIDAAASLSLPLTNALLAHLQPPMPPPASHLRITAEVLAERRPAYLPIFLQTLAQLARMPDLIPRVEDDLRGCPTPIPDVVLESFDFYFSAQRANAEKILADPPIA